MLLIVLRLFFARCRYVHVIVGCVLLVVGHFRSFLAPCGSFQVVPRLSKYPKTFQRCLQVSFSIQINFLFPNIESSNWKSFLKKHVTETYFFLEKATLNWWWKHIKNISEGIPLYKSLLASTSLQLCWKWIVSQVILECFESLEGLFFKMQ